MNSLPRFMSNIAVAIVLLIGAGLIFGGHGAACWMARAMQPWLLTIGMCMSVGGLIYWIFSQFKHVPALLLAGGGILVVQLPGLVLHYGGIACAAS